MYCTYHLTANQGEFLSFGRLVGEHRALCIDLHESMLLIFQQHDIIPPMVWNLSLVDPRTINKFNDTLYKSSVKHDIDQNVHHLHSRAIYPPQAHLARDFKNWTS